MGIYYYLTIFPIESLIASMLDPFSFGSYLATGSKKGSYENNIFIEIEPEFSDAFDWEYAKKKCVPSIKNEPKHSVYLSIYRTLEMIPCSKMKKIFLTTKDGRTLELEKIDKNFEIKNEKFYIYQELCPTRPLVTTTLNPIEYIKIMTDEKSKMYIPKLVFTDIKAISFHSEKTGSIGPLYDRNIEHLHNCINEVTLNTDKKFKIVKRSNVDKFSYQIIGSGIYIGDKNEIIFYKMKTVEELRKHNYDWGRSALIF